MVTKKAIQHILVILFLSVFFLDYLSLNLRLIPRAATWLPEFISLLLFGIILIILAITKKINLQQHYFWLFFIYLCHVSIGAIYNTVPAGSIFAGLRTYFRYIPVFFLPCVYSMGEKSIRFQLKLFFLLSLFQAPLSLYQRFFQFAGIQTGDVVTGTINSPSILVIYQLSVISVLFAMYINDKVSLKFLLFMSLIIFVPCTINETKAVIILLPISVLAITFFSKSVRFKIRRLAAISTIMVLLIAIFVPIYNNLIQEKWGYGIVDFLSMEGRVKGYLYKGASGKDDDEKIGRIDSINLALEYISENPMSFVFGYGIGNVTKSAIPFFKGDYTDFQTYGAEMCTLSNLLYETGVGGVLLIITFLFLSFLNAASLRTATNDNGFLGLSWIGICVMLLFSLIYKNLIHSNITFLFVYFAGYIASESYQHNQDKEELYSHNDAKES